MRGQQSPVDTHDGAAVPPLEPALGVEADIERGLQQLLVLARGDRGGGGRAGLRHRHQPLVHLRDAPTLRRLVVVISARDKNQSICRRNKKFYFDDGIVFFPFFFLIFPVFFSSFRTYFKTSEI